MMRDEELAARLAELPSQPLAAQAAALEDVYRALHAEFSALSEAATGSEPTSAE